MALKDYFVPDPDTTEIVIFDTETTGLRPRKELMLPEPALYELAAVRVRRGEVVETFAEVLNPGAPLDEKWCRDHDIIDTDWPMRVGVDPAGALARFAAFVGEAMLCGHNAESFDVPIVAYWLTHYGITLPPAFADKGRRVDSLLLARSFYSTPGSPEAGPASFGLDDLAAHYGFSGDAADAHSADFDVKMLAHLLPTLLRQARALQAAPVAGPPVKRSKPDKEPAVAAAADAEPAAPKVPVKGLRVVEVRVLLDAQGHTSAGRKLAFRRYLRDPRPARPGYEERVRGEVWVSDAHLLVAYDADAEPIYRRSLVFNREDLTRVMRGTKGPMVIAPGDLAAFRGIEPRILGWLETLPAERAGALASDENHDRDYASELDPALEALWKPFEVHLGLTDEEVAAPLPEDKSLIRRQVWVADSGEHEWHRMAHDRGPVGEASESRRVLSVCGGEFVELVTSGFARVVGPADLPALRPDGPIELCATCYERSKPRESAAA